MHSVLSLLDREHFLDGYTRLATHEWLLNPFAFFGSTIAARLHSVASYFLLFTTVAVGALPVFVQPRVPRRVATTVSVGLLVTGPAIAIVVWKVHMVTIARLDLLDPALRSAVSATFLEKSLAFVLVLTAVNWAGRAVHRWVAAP